MDKWLSVMPEKTISAFPIFEAHFVTYGDL